MCNKEYVDSNKQTVTIVTIQSNVSDTIADSRRQISYIYHKHLHVTTLPYLQCLRWWLEFFHASITNIQNFVMFLSHRGNQGRATMWEKQRCVEWKHFHPSLRVWWVSHIFELRCLVKAEITPERRSTVSFDFFTCDTAIRNVFGGLIWKPQLGVLSLRSVCHTERPRAVDAEFLALCTTAWHFSRFRSLLFSNTPSFRGAPWEPSGNVSSPMEKNII